MSSSVRTVEIDRIEVDESLNDRRNYEGIPELARSIAECGLLQPLVVFSHRTHRDGDRFTLRAGFRRMRAIQKLREGDRRAFAKVAVVVEKGNDADAAVVGLAENIQRRNLTPGEVAEGLYRLRNLGLSQADIGRRLGITQGYVSTLLRCREVLPEAGRAAFIEGRLPVDVATEIARLDDGEREKRLKAVLGAATSAEVTRTGPGDYSVALAPEDKKAARKAARKANDAAAGTKRPGVKELRERLGTLEEPGKPESPFLKGVAQGLEFALGERQRFAE